MFRFSIYIIFIIPGWAHKITPSKSELINFCFSRRLVLTNFRKSDSDPTRTPITSQLNSGLREMASVKNQLKERRWSHAFFIIDLFIPTLKPHQKVPQPLIYRSPVYHYF
ncbi:hypothetical protein F5879DRAFT_184508 [Lentinula edodes]|nr:hypothetical protein F5879DRAFT_184508 [Lentinula edodes]